MSHYQHRGLTRIVFEWMTQHPNLEVSSDDVARALNRPVLKVQGALRYLAGTPFTQGGFRVGSSDLHPGVTVVKRSGRNMKTFKYVPPGSKSVTVYEPIPATTFPLMDGLPTDLKIVGVAPEDSTIHLLYSTSTKRLFRALMEEI